MRDPDVDVRDDLDLSERPEIAATAPCVEVRGLARTFGDHQVFSGVDFRVSSGEIHAIIGANGAGKSTILRVLAGAVAPTAGSARIMGHDPRDRRARTHIGWLPSTDRSFYLRLSGIENLVFFGRLHGLSRAAVLERSGALLEALGLQDAARRRTALYSRGMLRRLSVARALLARPAVLLLDEPTHDLDPDGVSITKELVRASGAAVVWATQQLNELDAFVDDVLVLAGSVQRYDGPLPALIERNRGTRHVLRIHASDVGRLAGFDLDLVAGTGVTLERIGSDGRVVVELRPDQTLGALVAALDSAGLRVVACRPEQGELEEALLRLIRQLDDD